MEIDHRLDEDLERMPDGIPHAVVGLTAFYAVVLAVAIIATLSNATHAIAIVLAAIAIPMIVSKLARKAERERDVAHPSR
jgi:hypothetical protein